VEATIQGRKTQPSKNELRRIEKLLKQKKRWKHLFPGVSQIEISPQGSGASLSLRLTKKSGIPVVLVPEGTPGASVVAVKRVDELGFYNLGATQLASKVGLSMNKTVAAVRVLKIDQDPDCFKEFIVGRSRFKRYSQRAINKIKDALTTKSIDEIWREYRSEQKAA